MRSHHKQKWPSLKCVLSVNLLATSCKSMARWSLSHPDASNVWRFTAQSSPGPDTGHSAASVRLSLGCHCQTNTNVPGSRVAHPHAHPTLSHKCAHKHTREHARTHARAHPQREYERGDYAAGGTPPSPKDHECSSPTRGAGRWPETVCFGQKLRILGGNRGRTQKVNLV